MICFIDISRLLKCSIRIYKNIDEIKLIQVPKIFRYNTVSVSVNRGSICAIHETGYFDCWGKFEGDIKLPKISSNIYTSVSVGWKHKCVLNGLY